MNRRELFLSLAGGGLAGCRPQSRDIRKLRVSLVPRFTLAPVYLADELGFFREERLAIEILKLPETTRSIPLLAGGQLDVVFGTATPGFFNGVMRGARMKIVGSREVVVRGCGREGTVYGNRKAFPHGLDSVKLLAGKRVSVPSKTSVNHFFLDVLLESAGMTMADVRLLTLRPAEAAAALVGGKIDALVYGSFENDIEFASAGIVRGPCAADLIEGLQYTFIFFGGALLEGDPAAGTGFLTAYVRGVREFMNGKEPRAFDQLARATRADPGSARAECRERLTRDGVVDRVSVQRFLDWGRKLGYVPSGGDAGNFIDDRFAEGARRRLERGKAG